MKIDSEKEYSDLTKREEKFRSHRDLNSDRWIQSPEC